MAAVPLFWYINMAAVTSCENALYDVECESETIEYTRIRMSSADVDPSSSDLARMTSANHVSVVHMFSIYYVQRLQNINSASDKRLVIDARSAIYVYRYGGKHLLRRIPPASYGSLNSSISISIY